MRLHIEPILGRVQLRKLTPAHVQKVLTVKAEDRLSPRSVQHILLVLRIRLGQAERWGLVSRNVARLVDGPRVPYRAVSVLTRRSAEHCSTRHAETGWRRSTCSP